MINKNKNQFYSLIVNSNGSLQFTLHNFTKKKHIILSNKDFFNSNLWLKNFKTTNYENTSESLNYRKQFFAFKLQK